MAEQKNYEPCFADVPADWQGRWTLLREFIRRWHGIPVGNVGEPSTLVTEEEAKLEQALPPSFREWISLCEQLLALDAFDILRDCYEVVRLEDHAAISLLIQGEADVYWAVKEENLSLDDPPVDWYPLDYETDGEPFIHAGKLAPHITSFVLRHLAYYLQGNGGSAHVTVKVTDAFLAQMHTAFPVASRFDHLRIFEKENIFALIVPDQHDPTDYDLLVQIWQPIPLSQVPECILKNLHHGGAFSGMLYGTKKIIRVEEERELYKAATLLGMDAAECDTEYAYPAQSEVILWDEHRDEHEN